MYETPYCPKNASELPLNTPAAFTIPVEVTLPTAKVPNVASASVDKSWFIIEFASMVIVFKPSVVFCTNMVQ